jgi:hypothetical protein
MLLIDRTKYDNFDKKKTIKVNSRSCGDCSFCCDGWLSAGIWGHDMYPGKPCKFKSKDSGCGIYHQRPQLCKDFLCLYRQDSKVPEHLKPNIIGNVMMNRELNGIPYIEIVEGFNSIDMQLIDWALDMFHKHHIDSFRYFYNGKTNFVSRNEEFTRLMTEKNADIA